MPVAVAVAVNVSVTGLGLLRERDRWLRGCDGDGEGEERDTMGSGSGSLCSRRKAEEASEPSRGTRTACSAILSRSIAVLSDVGAALSCWSGWEGLAGGRPWTREGEADRERSTEACGAAPFASALESDCRSSALGASWRKTQAVPLVQPAGVLK